MYRMTKIIPKKQKCKRAKWLSEEALQTEKIREKRQRRKGKICPNAQFQRTARTDKNAFLG